MKQYLIDELRLDDYEKLKQYLDDYLKSSSIDGVYWLTIPEALLTETQMSHIDCQPYYFAVELYEQSILCGLLVRTASSIRCHCIGYASVEQRNWLIDTIDSIMEQNKIII